MPAYETQLIADFKTGYATQREPWLLPADAFPTLLDARVDKGVLKKRAGITQIVDTTAGYPIMGLHATMQLGHPIYLVADTHDIYKFDPYDESLSALTSDVFTGKNMDFFWFQDWRDKCYICNHVDAIYIYDRLAGTMEALDSIVQSAKMIFRYKSRLLFVSPVVGGTWYPRRLYYSNVNTETVDESNYVNVDIEDVPMSGCYMKGVPTIFYHEKYVGRVKYTFNSDTPFAVEEVSDDGGVLGPCPAPKFGGRAVQLGHSRLLTWDGYEINHAATQIRDFRDEVDLFYAWYLQATVRRDRNVLYLAYPNSGSTSNDRILEHNLDDNVFAIHRLSAHSFYSATGHFVLKAEDVDELFGSDGDDEIEWNDLHPLRHPTYGGFTLMGGHTGKVYLMNEGTTDAGSTISASVLSIELNPYAVQGRKCKLGNIRVLVGTATKSCTLKLYKDQRTTEYKSMTLDASGSGTNKHWEIDLHGDGEVGNFHQIEFSGDLPDIHAVEIETAPDTVLDDGAS